MSTVAGERTNAHTNIIYIQTLSCHIGPDGKRHSRNFSVPHSIIDLWIFNVRMRVENTIATTKHTNKHTHTRTQRLRSIGNNAKTAVKKTAPAAFATATPTSIQQQRKQLLSFCSSRWWAKSLLLLLCKQFFFYPTFQLIVWIFKWVACFVEANFITSCRRSSCKRQQRQPKQRHSVFFSYQYIL